MFVFPPECKCDNMVPSRYVCPATDPEAFKKPEEDRMWTHIIMLVLLIFLYPRKADQLWALVALLPQMTLFAYVC